MLAFELLVFAFEDQGDFARCFCPEGIGVKPDRYPLLQEAGPAPRLPGFFGGRGVPLASG